MNFVRPAPGASCANRNSMVLPDDTDRGEVWVAQARRSMVQRAAMVIRIVLSIPRPANVLRSAARCRTPNGTVLGTQQSAAPCPLDRKVRFVAAVDDTKSYDSLTIPRGFTVLQASKYS